MSTTNLKVKLHNYLTFLCIAAFCFTSMEVWAQNSVTGKVTSKDDGSAIPGVNIVVKGTNIGTITDLDGNYSLTSVSSDAVLIFSSVGYIAQEILVGNQSQINVSLVTDVQTLAEVVVVGYGEQKKSDVTGSIASIASKDLDEVPVANLQQALQSRAAGLEVQRIGTTPGAGAQIRIRGERTISGSNDPLIVLDGIPYQGNITDINPDEIESIEVLKDASATAIYGSRGANGVIIISSRRGVEGPVRINIDSYYGVATVARRYDVYSPEEYVKLRNVSLWNGGYMPWELGSFRDSLPTNEIIRSTDWQDLMYKDGYITNHNLSVSGGGKNNQFSLGAGYFKETTVLPGQDFQRGSLRASIDTKAGQKFKMGFSTLNTISFTQGSQFGLNMFPILALSPLSPPYNPDGSIFITPSGNVDDEQGTYSPLLVKDGNDNEWVDKVRRLRTFNSLYGEYEIIKGLKYRLNVGLEYEQEEADQFRGADSYFRPRQGNTARVSNAETWSYTLEHLLIYDKTIATDHRIGVTALFSAQEAQFHNSFLSKDSINADFIRFYDLGQSNQSVTNLPTYGGSENKWGLLSYMIRINYAFKDKYLVTITGRRDGSSRLGGKYTNYPAISLGWNIANESFMENVRAVTALKLRVGWGQTSNQSVAPYTTIGGASSVLNGNRPIRYNYGTQIVQGYYFSSASNPDLDWEYTRTINIGLDFGFFKNRLTGSFDWYNAQTNNILYGLALPISSGIRGSYTSNIGEMENKGVEIQLSSVNLDLANGFRWETDLNVFWNRNKLLKLNDGFINNIGNGLHLGHPLSAIFDYTKLGVWQTNEATEAAEFGQAPGGLKIADLNDDGQINAQDRSVIGDAQADWQGGITNRFYFKGFDLSVVAYVRVGGLLTSGLHAPLGAYLTENNGRRNQIKVDYWTEDNPTNLFPKPGTTYPAGNSWTTLAYYDASFVKIRSINLGYTFPAKVLESMKLRSLRVYFTAQNPFLLFSPYRKKVGGPDPEATGTGTNGFVQNGGNIPNRALTITASTPPTRSFIFGINLGF